MQHYPTYNSVQMRNYRMIIIDTMHIVTRRWVEVIYAAFSIFSAPHFASKAATNIGSLRLLNRLTRKLIFGFSPKILPGQDHL